MKVEKFYTNKKFSTENVGASELYLLSWIDAIERLDILILETRHLQINIINDLREPALFLPIRYEEKYLWGEGWEKNLEKVTPKELAKDWIFSFPDRRNDMTKKNSIDELSNEKLCKKTSIELRLNILIDKIWNKGSWSQEQRANYYSLKALQILKREILRDKLELSYHALFIARLHQFQTTKEDLYFAGKNIHRRAEFMVLRGAILYKANKDYIERLRDYQYQFSKTVDTFVDDTASSNKYRRRDLGVYTDFLRNRTLGIYTETIHLLNYLDIKNNKEKESIILHNWMHSHTSRSKYYKNFVSNKNVTHITTSYWMPERPDLQPIIAHEIAHKFIKSRLGDIHSGDIAYLNDDFSFFLLRLHKKIDDFSNNSFGITVDPKAITRELSCDFIAASIKGIKYVYAHFIELLGNDISFFGSLTRNGQDIDYDNITHFSYAHLDQFHDNRLWYLRIKVILKWLETTQHSENSVLDNELIDGINKIVADILDLYRSLALTEKERKKEEFWVNLTNHLRYIIDDSSNITSKIKKWKDDRANDVFHKKSGKKNTKNKYPRSVARIDIRVRDILYKTQRYMKTQEGRLLKIFENESADTVSNAFENVYGVNFKLPKTKNLDQKQTGNDPIYLHIYDIIWQSSMMRAKDLLFNLKDTDEESSNKKNKIITVSINKNHCIANFLKNIHFNFPMGRDLFSFALEFSIFDQDSPHDRLMTINHLLDVENNIHKKEDNYLYEKIKEWYDGTGFLKEKNSVDILLNDIKLASRASPEHRKISNKIGNKIKDIFILLKNNLFEVRKNELLIPVYYFLKTKTKYDNKTENLFHKSIIEGFSLNRNNKLKNDEHSLSIGYLVSNISLSASYAQLRENEKQNNSFETATHNALKQTDILKSEQRSWSDPEEKKSTKKCFYFKQLGRYDIFKINPATSLTRCTLPFFPGSNESVQENFPSFFAKKEMAIPFVLGRKPWNEDLASSKILVTLRIKLKQRSYRLSFLYRLRMTCLRKRHYTYKRNFIENMQPYFQVAKEKEGNENIKEDCAFLIDGADDVILLFMAQHAGENTDNEIKERLDQILTIQNSIYEDFMVDRTRLAFTQDCLQAVRAGDKDEYKAIIFIRLLEDRYLSAMNFNYLKRIKEKININFYKTPGEYDYYADITDLIKQKEGNINEIINDLSDSKYVDSINTKLIHQEK